MNLDFPSELQSNLEELKNFYQRQIEHASLQLAHLEALLQNSTVPSVSEEFIQKPVAAPTVKIKARPAIFNASAQSSPTHSAVTAKSAPRAKVKPKTTTRSKPSDILALRPPYHGQTLLMAISQVLRDSEGKKVNADTVVKELHGDLPLDLFRLAKERITKNLSKGKLEKRWDSVPDQAGLYTFSLSSLGKTND